MDKARRNVWAIALAFFFIFFGFGTAQQYLVILFSSQGQGHLALFSLFILYGTFLVSGIFAANVIPFLGGLKRSLMLGALTYALFALSVAFQSAPILYAASALIGFGASLLWVSSGQIVADSSNETTATRNFAWRQIGLYLGNIFGINAGAYLITIFPLAKTFIILAAAILAGFLLLLWIKPLKEEVEARPFKPFYIFDRKVVMLFPLIFAADFMQAQVFTAMNLIVVNLLGMGFIALVVSILKVSNIAGSLSSGILAAKYSKAMVLALFVLMALSGSLLFVASETIYPLLFGALLLGLSMASIHPVTLAWLKDALPPEEYPYALGAFYVYSNVGVLAAVGSNLVLPPRTSFLPGIIALILALAGITLFNRWQKVKTSENI
ncbi:MAG: MFS transporter [bacterium]|nr:MFS transporter [bacterium]